MLDILKDIKLNLLLKGKILSIFIMRWVQPEFKIMVLFKTLFQLNIGLWGEPLVKLQVKQMKPF